MEDNIAAQDSLETEFVAIKSKIVRVAVRFIGPRIPKGRSHFGSFIQFVISSKVLTASDGLVLVLDDMRGTLPPQRKQHLNCCTALSFLTIRQG